MKINEINWAEVPDIITNEQVRLICHCSKRTALFYLKSGKLPCVYSGKKTRCYKIRKEDLIAFFEAQEKSPEFYAVPDGWYGSTGTTIRRQYSSILKLDNENLYEYYQYLLREYPDVLEAKKISEITGYSLSVVNRWCSNGKLKHFVVGSRNLIPKVYLIDFFCSLQFRKICRKSEWHIRILENYRHWKYSNIQRLSK